MLSSGHCQCVIGTEINGVCNLIDGCVAPFDMSDGSQGCLACNSTDFLPTPVAGVC
jgi:hypothetical protein